MTQREYITEESGITPHLEPITQKEALSILQRRRSSADLGWFVGNSTLTMDSDEVTSSHGLFELTRRLHGVYETLPAGSVIAVKSLIVPHDRSEEGVDAFTHEIMTKHLTEYDQYGRALVNEPTGIMRRTSVDHLTLLETNKTGLELASIAVNQVMNGSYRMSAQDEEQTAEVLELHRAMQNRLGILHSNILKSGVRYPI